MDFKTEIYAIRQHIYDLGERLFKLEEAVDPKSSVCWKCKKFFCECGNKPKCKTCKDIHVVENEFGWSECPDCSAKECEHMARANEDWSKIHYRKCGSQMSHCDKCFPKSDDDKTLAEKFYDVITPRFINGENLATMPMYEFYKLDQIAEEFYKQTFEEAVKNYDKLGDFPEKKWVYEYLRKTLFPEQKEG